MVFAVVRALAERLGAGLVWPDPDRELDLVALATVADAVPLVGQNRRLVIRGIAEMRDVPTRRHPSRYATRRASTPERWTPARWATASPR